ncbi:hypothetical protein PAPYR_9220 [Paratrimastix pyriformis]|uniref:Uncharacterized protein n=1 Tax=Paratrimastix pyriformis TaxID=342808 RepID=A0ABQ8U8U3_9EUKA|nr:hypothetical protein PAPYR_9220 [Paratrimastix pyriformis]
MPPAFEAEIIQKQLISDLTQTGNSHYSICFNIKNKGTHRVRITKIHFCRSGEHSGVNVQIYRTKDKRHGFENATNESQWTMCAQGTRDFSDYSGGRNAIYPFQLRVPLELEAGDTVGIWIQTSDNCGVEFSGEDVPLGTVSMQDNNLQVLCGPYGSSNTPFTSRNANRRLTGTIIDYEVEDD